MKEFKPGDCIRHSTGNYQIKELTEENELEFTSICGNDIRIDSSELWQPKQGEWCWFYSEEQPMPNLRQFDYKKNNHYWTKDNNLRSDFFGYSSCEPFIGELPSFLKD